MSDRYKASYDQTFAVSRPPNDPPPTSGRSHYCGALVLHVRVGHDVGRGPDGPRGVREGRAVGGHHPRAGRDVSAGGQSRFAETGSGVLISRDGRVMTAAHVVHSMDEITVQFLGGETVPARVVFSEPAADLSLLQLERVPPGATVAAMADSTRSQVGDPVIIVGAPYGLAYSLSAGYISARWAPNTVYKTMPLAEFFQTTATINTGNSGGPMFAMNGEVIGIVSHNISKSGGSEGLGFVVTLNTAKHSSSRNARSGPASRA